MQSLKGETDSLYKTIAGFEENTREAAGRADQADCNIRDYGKKVQQLEIGFDETNDKLTKANESLEEADKQFKDVESDVSALTRRIMLMEEEDKKSAETLCSTITKLAMTSKAADNVMKTIMANDGKCSMDHRGTQDTGGPQGDKAPSVASACSPPALSRSCRDSRRE